MIFFFSPTGVSATAMIAGRASGYLPPAALPTVGSTAGPVSSLIARP